MKKVFLFFMAILGIVIIFVNFAFAQDVSAKKENKTRFGIGFGIPYGVIGGNFEISLNEFLGLSMGLGMASVDVGWALGLRMYLAEKDKMFRPRLSIFRGIVGILETPSWVYRSRYQGIEGNALGVGFACGRIDLDLIIPFGYEVPDGSVEQGSNLKISIGYHFK